MKKTAKNIVLMLVMVLMLVSLTACGGNKIVATRETEDPMMGSYKETIEIKFKDDKVSEAVMTMEFDSKEKAEAIAAIYNSTGDTDGVKVKQSGKKLTITMDAETYAKENGGDTSSVTKEDVKKSLEEAGYTVK